MNREEIDRLRQEARIAFKSEDFERAFVLSEKLAAENIPVALFRCGLILEKGWLNGVIDLDRAYDFYRKLSINWNDDEGYLGCVRIMLCKHDVEKRHEAVRYCLDATKGPVKRMALLILGRVYEELYAPPEYRLAKKAYLKAGLLGSGWALRKYAVVLWRSGNYIGAVFMHIVATICSPIFVLFGGLKTMRRG